MSHLQGIPQILFFALRQVPNTDIRTCYAIFDPQWLQNSYIIYTWFMQFLIPLIIIFFCYFSISVKVLNNNFFKSKQKETSGIKNMNSIKEKSVDQLESKMKLLNANEQITNVSNFSKTTKKNNNQNEQDHFRQHRSTKNINKSKIKTIKLTSSVIFLYIVCSTPYFIGILLNVVLNPSQFMRLSKFCLIVNYKPNLCIFS